MQCWRVHRGRRDYYGYDIIGPFAWVTNPDGSWRVAAAPSEVTGDDDGTGAGTARVRTKVALKVKTRTRRPDLLVGRVAADRGCASSRAISLVGKQHKSVKRIQTTHQGHFTIVLTNAVTAKLNRKALVNVVKKEKGSVTCLPAKSRRVRVK